MSDPSAPISSWSKDKLDLLGKYLHAYSVIMNNQKKKWLKRYSYIDAFACIGEYVDPDTQGFVDGSPLVALACTPPFDDYWFIELSSDRLEKLRDKVRGTSHAVYFRQDDANVVLQKEVTRAIKRSEYARGFVFLDPYGLQIDFATVQKLGEAAAFDIFVNFSVMGITRLLQRDALPDPQTLAILSRVMGDASWVSNWIDGLYWKTTDFFGQDHYHRPPLEPNEVALLYQSRVQAHFPHMSKLLVMRNSKDAALYALFLASHSPAAIKITNDIIDKYEKSRGQLF